MTRVIYLIVISVLGGVVLLSKLSTFPEFSQNLLLREERLTLPFQSFLFVLCPILIWCLGTGISTGQAAVCYRATSPAYSEK